MMLAPGAINTGNGTHLSIRFVGRARDDNNWTFDGIDATGVKDPRQDSTARLIISTESVAEFLVSSSMYSAASGTAAGGQVQLISKTGSNSFRGTAYDFIRNDKFDAKPFGTVGKNPPFTPNQFGAISGAPLSRDARSSSPTMRDCASVRRRPSRGSCRARRFERRRPRAPVGRVAMAVGNVPDERSQHRRVANQSASHGR